MGVRWPRRAVFTVDTNGSQHGGSCRATARIRFQRQLVRSPSLTAKAKRLILEEGDYSSMRSERNLPPNRLNFVEENHRGAL